MTKWLLIVVTWMHVNSHDVPSNQIVAVFDAKELCEASRHNWSHEKNYCEQLYIGPKRKDAPHG